MSGPLAVVDAHPAVVSTEDRALCLLALVDALAVNCLSSDVWYLAHASAKRLAESMGVQNYSEVMVDLEKRRKQLRSGNPIAAMFDDE